MVVLKTRYSVGKSGRIKLNVPARCRNTEVDVVVIVDNNSSGKRTYDFSDIAGNLQWKGNAVKAQRKLRNEW